jgi:creatinine amidohydrolase
MMIIEEMTMKEFEEGLQRTRTVLIPFGSVEEHGLHLPLSTDTIQAYEVGKAAARRVPLFIVPPVHYGCCRSTSCHPGTISISTATLKNILIDIVRSMYKQGLRNFIILTGHAGGTHTMALLDAGEELLIEYKDAKIAVITEYDLAYEEGKGLIETEGDAHAGEIETSRILHLYPHLVKGNGKREFPNFPKGILVRDKKKYWKNGVWGDPERASAEKGKQIQELVTAKLVQFVKTIEQFEE